MEQRIEGAADVSAVKVFYSSRAQPSLLDAYADAFQYLKEADIAVDLVDIVEDAETARENDVVVTPTVIVEQGGERHRYLGVVDGLRTILEDDMYGRSILHQKGFGQGRELASSLVLTSSNTDEIADSLTEQLQGKGVEDISFESIDREANEATVTVCFDEDVEPDAHIHAQMAQILGGIFTELFETGVMGVEEECGLNSETSSCTLHITAEDEDG